MQASVFNRSVLDKWATDGQNVASEVVIKQVKTGNVWRLVKQVEVETEEWCNRFFVLTHCGNYSQWLVKKTFVVEGLLVQLHCAE